MVRAECAAEILVGLPPPSGVPAYVEKYREAIARIGFDVDGFSRAYPVPVRPTPTRWQVW